MADGGRRVGAFGFALVIVAACSSGGPSATAPPGSAVVGSSVPPTTVGPDPTPPPESSSGPDSTDSEAGQPPVGIVGPWYQLALLGAAAGEIESIGSDDTPPGTTTAVWASPDQSFREVLVLEHFTAQYAVDHATPDHTTITGGVPMQSGPYGQGTTEYIATPDDPRDTSAPPDSLDWAYGNQFRWRKADGELFEFAYYGPNQPGWFGSAAMVIGDRIAPGCECRNAYGLEMLVSGDRHVRGEEQSVEFEGGEVTLARFPDGVPRGIGGAADWGEVRSVEIDGASGFLVDETTAFWPRDGMWFTLEQIPVGRADEIIGSLRRTGGAPSALPGWSVGLAAGWNRLPDPPLSPRAGATAVWTGAEIVILGGDEFLCPPDADCGYDGPMFADGAAFDVATGTWRPIADAPFGFANGRAIELDGDVFVLAAPDSVSGPLGTPGSATLLRYRVAEDRWEQIADTPANLGTAMTATDVSVIIYDRSDETGGAVDWSYSIPEISGPDYPNGRWWAMPDEGWGPNYDRFIVRSRYSTMVFGKQVAAEGDSGLSPLLAAVLHDGGEGWESITVPDGVSGYQAWMVEHMTTVNPHFGGSSGGVYDTFDELWSDLPPDAPVVDLAGVVGFGEARYAYDHGWMLDQTTGRYVEAPQLDARERASTAAVGRNLLIVGGSRWPTTDAVSGGKLLADAWLWVPPSAAV